MFLVCLREPIKPSNDDREYKCIQLLSNGMKVVLVRDPKEEKSAASLSLPVGHCSDPDYAPGLAHFLEHLLFLGTTKYPKEGEYVAHIKANGGTYNAYTSGLETVYYFDILSGVMEPTLDRFAQFFIAPLFDESCVERELSAVDSEHAKNVQTDSRRFYQLSKSLADAKHPFSKFGTGNRETLKTTSEAKGIKIRDEVIKFYKSFYSANLMTLAIVSNQSFETMQEWVVSKFSAVPTNKDAKVPSFADFDHPFAGNIGELRHIVPVRDDRFLRFG
jgi:insulysin